MGHTVEQALKKGGFQRYKWIILLVGLAIFATLPLWSFQYVISVFSLIFLYLSLGQMWNLLAGYAGLISLGQQMFVGLGGYSLAVLTEYYQLPVFVGMALGGIICVLFALIISMPIFKMRGVYFAIGTWIAAEALAVFFGSWTYVHCGQGLNITVAYNYGIISIYYIALVLGLGSLGVVYYLLRSKLGLALMAMRDNESAAETLGIDLFRAKLFTFLISAFVTGVTGAALYLSIGYIEPNAALGINWTVVMVFIVIIGGIGTVEGPILGSVFYVVINQLLYGFPGISMIILGVIAVLTIILLPKGVMGTTQDRFGFEILSVRRGR